MMRLLRSGALKSLFCYLLLSWLLFDHGAGLGAHLLGYGADPALIMWFFAWWPWAVIHHALAWQTHLVWQPRGLNLAWTTSVPLLSLLAAPISLTAGPLVAYNVLLLLAPALAAFSAMLLCTALGAPPLGAWLGGLLFGFSSFTAAQSLDHLNLLFTALLPISLLVALRRVQGKGGRGFTVLALGLLLGGDFLISNERLAMSCLFAALGFAIAWGSMPGLRPRLRLLAVDVICAAPIALLLAAPILLGMVFGHSDLHHPANWAATFSIDALNLLVPTQASLLGGQIFAPLSAHFGGALDEQSGYLGLLLLALPVMIYDLRHVPAMRTLSAMLGIGIIASLGPYFHLAGHNTGLKLPWLLVSHVPLLGAALPARCMVFVMLCAAMLAALWLAQAASVGRYVAVAVVSIALLPALHAPQPAPDEAFFRPGRVQAVLGPQPRLLILPFAINGAGSYWQAENKFGFTQVGGYLGFPPGWARAQPAVDELFGERFSPQFARHLAAFCQSSGAQYVVTAQGTPAPEWAALASLHWRAQKIDDVTIFTVPTP